MKNGDIMLIVYILPLLATITYEKNIKTVCSGFKSFQLPTR